MVPDHLEGQAPRGAAPRGAYRSAWTSIAGKDALLGQLAVEDELAVARPLEFLVDDVVHTRSGIYEAGADDRERAAFFDVSGGTEETLGRVEGDRIETARKSSA